MTIKTLAIIPVLVILFSCGGSDEGGASETKQNESSLNENNGSSEKDEKTKQFTYIEKNDNGMNYVDMDIVELNDSKSILGSSKNNPIDVYPNSSFEFRWQLESNVVVFANSFLVLNINGSEIPVFATIMNPYPEILTNKATCEYNNNHMLICSLIEIPQHIGARAPTDLSLAFSSLPKTYEVFSSICSITRGCDKIRLGYIRFN